MCIYNNFVANLYCVFIPKIEKLLDLYLNKSLQVLVAELFLDSKFQIAVTILQKKIG